MKVVEIGTLSPKKKEKQPIILKHFKFENCRFGEFENSIFDVANRAIVWKWHGNLTKFSDAQTKKFMKTLSIEWECQVLIKFFFISPNTSKFPLNLLTLAEFFLVSQLLFWQFSVAYLSTNLLLFYELPVSFKNRLYFHFLYCFYLNQKK